MIPGLNRRHYLRNGRAKVGFDTEEESRRVMKAMLARDVRPGLSLDAYLCDECDQWHVGNKPASKRDRVIDPLFELGFEIGGRAAACLAEENLAHANSRFSKIAQRFEVAERRRLQYHPTPPTRKSRVLP